jgi:uncharacterized protein (TIGR00288 family)
MDEKNIAIYLDFENLVISAEQVYPSKGKPLLLEPIVDYFSSRGNICIKKAYADWSQHIFSQYQRSLIEYGFEMIHLPATTTRGKNGADVKLAIDTIENMTSFEMIDTFVIGSGDTDFLSLIQHIRARGKKVIVAGFEHSAGTLIKTSSSEFKSLDELLGTPEQESLSSDLVQEVENSYGRDLMIKYVLNKDDDEPVQMSKLKLDLIRLAPSFSEKKLGFCTFKKYVESLLEDVVDRIEPSRDSGLPIVFFKEVELPLKEEINVRDEAESFLQTNLRYLEESSERKEISQLLFEIFQEKSESSMNDMREEIYSKIKGVAKTTIRKFINTLFIANTFILAKEDTNESLLNRPFKLVQEIQNPETLEQRYINRVFEILKNRFPDLKEEDLQKMLL